MPIRDRPAERLHQRRTSLRHLQHRPDSRSMSPSHGPGAAQTRCIDQSQRPLLPPVRRTRSKSRKPNPVGTHGQRRRCESARTRPGSQRRRHLWHQRTRDGGSGVDLRRLSCNEATASHWRRRTLRAFRTNRRGRPQWLRESPPGGNAGREPSLRSDSARPCRSPVGGRSGSIPVPR